MAEKNYLSLDRPYNDFMERGREIGGFADAAQDLTYNPQSGQAGVLSADAPDMVKDPNQLLPGTVSTGTFQDLFIGSSLRSRNYAPATAGFYLEGRTGRIECIDLYVKGGIVGSTLDLPDTTSANSFHVDANGNTWWGANKAAGYAAAPAYVLNTGVAKFEDVFIGDLLVTGDALSHAINSSSQLVGDINITNKLNTVAGEILTDFDFGTVNYAGAVKAGDIAWDINGVYVSGSGVAIYKGGIVGAKQGVGVTFTININGDATFVGTVTANAGAIGGAGGWAITTGVISSTNILLTSGAANAANITVGVGATAGGLNSAAVGTDIVFWAGSAHANRATANFRVKADGSVYASSVEVTGKIIANTSGSSITANYIDNGTLYVGGAGQAGSIVINRNGTNGYLTWTGSNKIWSDNSEYMGFNANGGRYYLYTNNGGTLMALLQSGSQAAFYDGLSSHGNFNVTTDATAARFEGIPVRFSVNGYDNQYIQATLDDMLYHATANHEFYQGSTIKAIIDSNIWTAGDLMAAGSKPFVIDHPTDVTKLLKYYAHEGDKVLIRTKGKVTLSSGEATVSLPSTWTLVTETGTLEVIVSPNGDCNGVYATVLSDSQIKIKELNSGTSNVEVSWECTAVRKGYLNAANIINK